MQACVHRKLMLSEERLWQAFCQVDQNGDGKVTSDELRASLQRLSSADRAIVLDHSSLEVDLRLQFHLLACIVLTLLGLCSENDQGSGYGR